MLINGFPTHFCWPREHAPYTPWHTHTPTVRWVYSPGIEPLSEIERVRRRLAAKEGLQQADRQQLEHVERQVAEREKEIQADRDRLAELEEAENQRACLVCGAAPEHQERVPVDADDPGIDTVPDPEHISNADLARDA